MQKLCAKHEIHGFKCILDKCPLICPFTSCYGLCCFYSLIILTSCGMSFFFLFSILSLRCFILKSDHLTVCSPAQVNAKPWSWTLPTLQSNQQLGSHWTQRGRPFKTHTCEWGPQNKSSFTCNGLFLLTHLMDYLFCIFRERLRTHSIESSGKLKISPEQHWDFTAEDLKDLGEIGRGAYGSVNKMVHKPSNQIMAVKVSIYLPHSQVSALWLFHTCDHVLFSRVRRRESGPRWMRRSRSSCWWTWTWSWEVVIVRTSCSFMVLCSERWD